MKLSKYTIIVENYPNQDEHLVYHTRTQALLRIEQPLREVLRRMGQPDYTPEAKHGDELSTLHRIGVLVRDEADDLDRLGKFMEQKKWGINKSLFHVTLLTTYNCNFACTYCFEESTRTSSQKMDLKTANASIAWLQRKVEKLGMKGLEVNFYGGEPLLNQLIIEHVSSCMKKWCDERGIVFKMSMQTNGALLTPELVDRYIPLGLVGAQVSVDGTKEVHDRNRPMRGSGNGTFDTIIQNLVRVVEKIQITVAAGYDKGDPSAVLELMNYMDSIGLLKKLKSITYAPIHPTLGPSGHTEQIISPESMKNYETEILLKTDAVIKKAMKEKGLLTKSGLSASMCPVTTGDSAVTIDTQGLVFKCNAMLGHPDLAVGSVHEDEYNDRHRSFMAIDAWKKCDADCPYVPLCNTGCRLFSMFKKGDFAAKSCERSYMDKFVPEAIKKEYENQMAKKQKETRVLTS